LEDAQTRTIRCCEWSPVGTGKLIACASFDGTVVIWEAQNSQKTRWEQVASLEGHENEVKSVSWSNNGQWLATCGRDKKVWVWEKLSGTQSEFECVSMLDGHTQDVKFVQWHPYQSNVLFSCSYDDTIKVWLEDDDEFFCRHTLQGHTNTVWGLTLDTSHNQVNENYCRFLSCSADLSLRLWEHQGDIIPSNTYENSDDEKNDDEWQILHTLSNAHKFPIYSCHWSTNLYNEDGSGSIIATAGGDNAISIVEVRKDETGLRLLNVSIREEEAHDGDVNCIRWGPNMDSYDDNITTSSVQKTNHILVTCGDDAKVKLWKYNA
jgi:WD40 repeat protein